MKKYGRFLNFLYVVIIVVVALAIAVGAQLSDSPAESSTVAPENQPINANESKKELKKENTVDLNSMDKKFFTKLFIRKRKEQIVHVAHLKNMDKYEHQYKIIYALAEKMIEIAETNKEFLEKLTETEIKNVSFAPTNDKNDTKDAISIILENTALFGDIVLNLPDITHRILKKQPEWNSVIRWSFNFLNRTRFLVDNATLEMVDLALQELNFVERKPDYYNKNKIQFKSSDKLEKSRKKEKRKRGPVLTKIEL